MGNADQFIIKKIKTEQDFAAAVYRNFREVAYGIESCCDKNLEDIVIQKELCDWQEMMPVDTSCEPQCR